MERAALRLVAPVRCHKDSVVDAQDPHQCSRNEDTDTTTDRSLQGDLSHRTGERREKRCVGKISRDPDTTQNAEQEEDRLADLGIQQLSPSRDEQRRQARDGGERAVP